MSSANQNSTPEHRFARYNPYLRNATFSYVNSLLNALRYHDTIVPKLVPVIFGLGLWSSFIVIVYRYLGINVAVDDKLITLLSVSLAMLLAFRINRGFERYWTGATLWTQLSIQIRNLARLIWNGIRAPTAEAEVEKMAMMKLLLGVAVASKYALRGENALEQKELAQLLPRGFEWRSYRDSLLELGGEAADENGTTTNVSTPRSSITTPHRSIPPLIFLRNRSFHNRSLSTPRKKNPQPLLPLPDGFVINTPIDIIHRISSYVRRQRTNGHIDVEDSPALISSVNGLIDAVSKFEQILYIPMPSSYDVHLKQILVLYFISLPFQLVRQMGWIVVPVTMIASLAFFGADAIAGEIEEPFGTDENDLPIDYFCKKLRGDIEYIMEMVLDIDDDEENGSRDEVGEDSILLNEFRKKDI